MRFVFVTIFIALHFFMITDAFLIPLRSKALMPSKQLKCFQSVIDACFISPRTCKRATRIVTLRAEDKPSSASDDDLKRELEVRLPFQRDERL
jgi:hypothetical protein